MMLVRFMYWVMIIFLERGAVQQDHVKSTQRSFTLGLAELGNSAAHYQLARIDHEGGDLKKTKFHLDRA